MVQLHRANEEEDDEEAFEEKYKKPKFCINDHIDLLIDILQKLDGHSLSLAACVCKLWCSIARNDSLWEHLCFRNVSPPSESVKAVVVALGGYKRLYMVCVRPVLSRLGRRRRIVKEKCGGGGGEMDSELARRWWNRHEVELSLSLFCVDYYEGLLQGGGGRGGQLGVDSSSRSLMFLCKPVNV